MMMIRWTIVYKHSPTIASTKERSKKRKQFDRVQYEADSSFDLHSSVRKQWKRGRSAMKKLQLVSDNDRNVPYKATFVTEALDMIRQDGID